MVTHPNILAWRIPWAEEPGGSQRVEHNYSDLLCVPHARRHKLSIATCVASGYPIEQHRTGLLLQAHIAPVLNTTTFSTPLSSARAPHYQ